MTNTVAGCVNTIFTIKAFVDNFINRWNFFKEPHDTDMCTHQWIRWLNSLHNQNHQLKHTKNQQISTWR